MFWTGTASASAAPMFLPSATAEQECIDFNNPTCSTLQETSSPVPGQADQLSRPAATPFLAAPWLTLSVLGICTEVSERLGTTAANPTLPLHAAVHSPLR